LKRPVIVVNFKVYMEADGPNALNIAKACESVAKETGANIIACPPMTELGAVARSVSIPVFSQNADPHAPGSSTGWVTPSMIKSSGATGTLINHSEHKMAARDIEETIELCKGIDLITIICADATKSAAHAATFAPDFIAVEPPELIGGDVSVTTANPGIIEKTVNAVKTVNKHISVLCGAGIKTGKDVKSATDLGADGVLIASGVVKAKDPRAALFDLAKHI